MDSNTFWSDNPRILFQSDKLKNFFPSANYAMVENLNVIVRLFFYLSIVLVLYSRNSQYLLLPLGAMFVTYLLFHYYPNKEELFYAEPINRCSLTLPEKISKMERKKNLERNCTMPTTENPFMNYNHITDNYHKPPACKAFLYDDPHSQEVKDNVEDKFNNKLYRSVTDLYSKRNSQREFYTIAYNQTPDQTSFAKWLFGQSGKICKENSLKCSNYSGSLI